MDLKDVLSKVRSSVVKRKVVDFPAFNLHFKLELLSTEEELKVMDKCKDLDGIRYFDMLKKATLSYTIKEINGSDIGIATTVGGKEVPSREYLFQEMGEWSSSLRDELFEAYSNFHDEYEDTITKGIKYDRFEKEVPIEKEEEKEFKEVVEKKGEDGDLGKTETEKMDDTVKMELEKAQEGLNSKE